MEEAIEILTNNDLIFEQRLDDPNIISCNSLSEEVANKLRKAGYVVVYGNGKTVISGA